jgi:hypothetical protein
MEPLTLRLATPHDAAALNRLAELDSNRAPELPTLVGDVAGELWAAISLVDGHAVADPFQPSAGVLELLRERVGVRSRGRDGLLPPGREAHVRRARRARPLARLLRA